MSLNYVKKEEIKKESCPDCEKDFHGYEDFQHHFETIHLGRRPFSCDYCQKAFKTIKDLAKHINIVHDRLETFKCDFCERTTTSKSAINNHIRIVHKFIHVKSNQCDVCSKLFDNKYYIFAAS